MDHKILKLVLQGGALIAIIALAFWLASLTHENETIKTLVESYGYIGIFIVALISGVNVAVPIPAVAFLPLFLESGLSFWPTIGIIAAGVTIADFVAYFIGKAGRHIIPSPFQEKLFTRYWWSPLVVLFLFAAFVPFPNEILLIPLGFLRYRAVLLFPVVLAGNLLFTILYATGLIELFRIL